MHGSELMAHIDRLCEMTHAAGKQSGFAAGKQSGYLAGNKTGFCSGEKSGFASGFKSGNGAGQKAGYESGEKDGYGAGVEDGYAQGEQEGNISGGVRVCADVPGFGVQHATLAGLYGKVSGGVVTMECLFSVYQISLASSGFKPAATLVELRITNPVQYSLLEADLKEHEGSKLYSGTGSSLKSTLCSGKCDPTVQGTLGTYCCGACAALLHNHSLRKRAQNGCNQLGAKASIHTRRDYLSTEQTNERANYLSDELKEKYFAKETYRRRALVSERRELQLRKKLEAAVSKKKYCKFIRAFQHAADTGNYPSEQLQHILEDIGKSLVGKHNWHNDSKSFLHMLARHRGPSSDQVCIIEPAWHRHPDHRARSCSKVA